MYKEYMVDGNGEVKELTEAQRVVNIVYNTLMDIECKKTGVNPRFIENMAYYQYALKTALGREGYDVVICATEHVPFDVESDDDEDEDLEIPIQVYNNPFIRL